MELKRYLYPHILNDLRKKMVFITGPRQVGKTFLAKQVMQTYQKPVYLNYDDIDDALIIQNRSWPHTADLVVFDELHKMKGWKQFLKGSFDTRPEHQHFLITGSARLETFRQTGDSLAGRYFHYRLHPFSVKELKHRYAPYEALSLLTAFGGFPEPFLSGSQQEALRWKNQYFTDLVREDILDFSSIQEVRSIRLLLSLLRKRVGSPLSYASLARDIQVSPNTIRKYMAILESLYIIFVIRPFHRNLARALLKEPKIYFYDSSFVDGNEGLRLENAVAVSLLKHVHYTQDIQGEDINLNYIRTKEGKEIDFCLTDKDSVTCGIEVKLSDAQPAASLSYFATKFPDARMVQLVHNIKREKDLKNISIVSLADWLVRLSA